MSRALNALRANFLMVIAAIVIVVCLVILINQNRTTAPPAPVVPPQAVTVSTPTPLDWRVAYPPLPGSAGATSTIIWTSGLEPSPGLIYTGRLTLRHGAFPQSRRFGAAYQLWGSLADVPRLHAMALWLHLKGPINHITIGKDRWSYVADGSGATLHSVAINNTTGELIYHNAAAQSRPVTAATPKLISAARNWLSGMGWPGGSM